MWIGNESMTRTTLQDPAFIAGYNLFINSVDIFDQFRSIHCTRRRENILSVSMFPYLLDASIQNEFTLLKNIFVTEEFQFTVPTAARFEIRTMLVAECRKFFGSSAKLSHKCIFGWFDRTKFENVERNGTPLLFMYTSQMDYVWLNTMPNRFSCEIFHIVS